MLRRIPRFLRVSVLLTIVAAVALTVVQSWWSGSAGSQGWTQTQWGPLGPADRDLIIRVRQANLWEQPTGQQATQMATSPAVREAGQHISDEHGQLDVKTRAIAEQLGIPLPTVPSTQQQAWMAEISAQVGANYDRTFVQRLREAHGVVIGILAQVRAGTRNSLVRQFADVGTTFVMRHIGYLESTGMVDYGALPQAPTAGLLSATATTPDLWVPLLVVVGALLTAIGLVLAFRRRPAGPVPPPTPRRGQRRVPARLEPELIRLPPAIPGPAPPVESTGPRHAVSANTRVR